MCTKTSYFYCTIKPKGNPVIPPLHPSLYWIQSYPTPYTTTGSLLQSTPCRNIRQIWHLGIIRKKHNLLENSQRKETRRKVDMMSFTIVQELDIWLSIAKPQGDPRKGEEDQSPYLKIIIKYLDIPIFHKHTELVILPNLYCDKFPVSFTICTPWL